MVEMLRNLNVCTLYKIYYVYINYDGIYLGMTNKIPVNSPLIAIFDKNSNRFHWLYDVEI